MKYFKFQEVESVILPGHGGTAIAGVIVGGAVVVGGVIIGT